MKNFYDDHPLMIDSGTFWRCDHGNTGFASGMDRIGCDKCAIAKIEVLRAQIQEAEKLSEDRRKIGSDAMQAIDRLNAQLQEMRHAHERDWEKWKGEIGAYEAALKAKDAQIDAQNQELYRLRHDGNQEAISDLMQQMEEKEARIADLEAIRDMQRTEFKKATDELQAYLAQARRQIERLEAALLSEIRCKWLDGSLLLDEPRRYEEADRQARAALEAIRKGKE